MKNQLNNKDMNHLYLDTLYAIAKNSNSLSSELPPFPDFKEILETVLTDNAIELDEFISYYGDYISFTQKAIKDTISCINDYQDTESILVREVLELLNF